MNGAQLGSTFNRKLSSPPSSSVEAARTASGDGARANDLNDDPDPNLTGVSHQGGLGFAGPDLNGSGLIASSSNVKLDDPRLNPLLPDHLEPHEFILAPSTSISKPGDPTSTSPGSTSTNSKPVSPSSPAIAPITYDHIWNGPGFEGKHVGPGCLKRIFIGPHRASEANQLNSIVSRSTNTTRGRESETIRADQDGTASEHSTSSESEGEHDEDDEYRDEVDDDEETAQRKARKREARARWKRRLQERDSKGKRVPTGETIRGGTMTASGSRKSSMHHWIGGSFEIGGDVREAMKRREEAKSKARTRSSSATSETNQRQSLGTGGGGDPAETIKTNGAQTFVTAKTHLARSENKLKNIVTLEQPSLDVEESLPPDLAHALLRRSSDVDLHETASLSAVPASTIHNSTSNLLPSSSNKDGDRKGILRTEARASLGHGYPSVNSHTYPPDSRAIDEFGRPQSVQSMPAPAATPTEMGLATKIRFSQPLLDQSKSIPGDQAPRPVQEVLARPDESDRKEVRMQQGEPVKPKRPGKNDVLKKERMLVRVEWTAREDLPDVFDENAARKFPTTGEGWEEYGVVWRPGRIELWNEYAVSAASWFLGHKKLAHVIPLAPARTKLSLYSSPDVVFCLTHKPEGHGLLGGAASHVAGRVGGNKSEQDPEEKQRAASKATRNRYIHRRNGTYVFIFRTLAMSVAKEWMWELFRGLGKSLPERIEISVPNLGAKIHLPVPNELQVAAYGAGRGNNAHQAGIQDAEEDAKPQGWRQYKPHQVVEASLNQLKKVTEWHALLAERDPSELKLCWRRGYTLDWVDIYGQSDTAWSLVCGFALRQAHVEPTLELRLGLHYPTTVQVAGPPPKPAPATATATATATQPDPMSTLTSHRLSEPPAIEGYVARLRKNGSSERIYLTSHDGHLFICSPSSCHPPEPPTPVHPGTLNAGVLALAPFAMGSGTRGQEQKRGTLWQRISRSASGISGISQDARKRDRAVQRVMAQSEEEVAAAEEGEEEASHAEEPDWLGKLEHFERIRAVEQILDAKGYIDLRDVDKISKVDNADSMKGEEYGTAQNDLGGEEGLNQAKDRNLMIERRTIVIRTKQGIEGRFECYSIAVRDEWIGRLQALTTYWTKRERVDAQEQMQLHPASSNRAATLARLRRTAATASNGFDRDLSSSGARIPSTSRATTRAEEDAEEEDDQGEGGYDTGALLSKAFNWCVLEGCRSILRCGKFYIKKDLRGQFKERYLILLPGSLLVYQTHKRDLHGQLVATSYHRRKRTISLRNCYVFSGRLTSYLLASSNGSSSGAWDPADSSHRFPRIYPGSDGLRVNDEEEDCTLVIFKRNKGATGGGKGGGGGRFGKAGTSHVLRARSRIERDEWVFALNAAIEKLRHVDEKEGRLDRFEWLDKT